VPPADDTDLDTLAKRLRYARERRGLRSRELSRKAQLASESHTSRIETGREKVDVGIISALAKALDVSMDWLVNGGPLPEGLGAPAEPNPTFRDSSAPTGTHGDG
jgi:transcriptional regulator with XRE-family HTH domain